MVSGYCGPRGNSSPARSYQQYAQRAPFVTGAARRAWRAGEVNSPPRVFEEVRPDQELLRSYEFHETRTSHDIRTVRQCLKLQEALRKAESPLAVLKEELRQVIAPEAYTGNGFDYIPELATFFLPREGGGTAAGGAMAHRLRPGPRSRQELAGLLLDGQSAPRAGGRQGRAGVSAEADRAAWQGRLADGEDAGLPGAAAKETDVEHQCLASVTIRDDATTPPHRTSAIPPPCCTRQLAMCPERN
jgi:hypothetical protein